MNLLSLFRRFVPVEDHYLSEAWIRQQQQRESKTGVNGQCITWPIRKLENENARWNRQRLRRRSA